MDAGGKTTLTQAGVCFVSGVMVWGYGTSLEGTEFSGGRLTGLLLDMRDVGLLLFVLALLLTFFYRRFAASITLIACLLCLPLYLYFTYPDLFRRTFPNAKWSAPPPATFLWDDWTVVGIVMMMLTAYVGICGLRRMESKDLRELRKGLD
jgi:hypothetical protein